MYQGPGIYMHYKGKQYSVLGVARHTETKEELVLYMPLYQAPDVFYVRPVSRFNQKSEDGRERFTRQPRRIYG